MRNARDGDAAHALIEAGLKLGLACPICRHRALIDLPRIAHDPRPVWRLPFRCACGEKRVFTYVLDDGEIESFEAGDHPKGTDGHHQQR